MTRIGLPSSLYGISVQAFFHNMPRIRLYISIVSGKGTKFHQYHHLIRNEMEQESVLLNIMVSIKLEDPESDQKKQDRGLLFSLQALSMT